MMNISVNSDVCGAEEIAVQLCAFLQENIVAVGVVISPTTDLSGIGVDSYALMELILYIERRYGLVLPPESLTPENIATVDTLSKYCAECLSEPDG